MRKVIFMFLILLAAVVSISVYAFNPGFKAPAQKLSGQGADIKGPQAGSAPVGENCVAYVGGRGITREEFRFFLLPIKGEMELEADADDYLTREIFWAGGQDGVDPNPAAKNRALDSVHEFAVELLRAQAEGIDTDEEDTRKLNGQIDEYVRAIGEHIGTDGKEDFERQCGIPVDKYKQVGAENILAQEYEKRQKMKIRPAGAEVEKYYEDNLEIYQEARVRHILIQTGDPDTRQPFPQDRLEGAKQRAYDLLDRVKKGEDMAGLAKQYSEDPGSKYDGGEYVFRRGEMVKEFEDWSFDSRVGDVGLVKTEFGYHVMKLEGKTSFDDIRAQVEKDLVGEIYAEQLAQWKKDPRYKLVINNSVFDSIKVNVPYSPE